MSHIQQLSPVSINPQLDKPMKKLIIGFLTCAAIAAPAFAGEPVVTGKDYKQPVIEEVTPCFADTEFTIDAFGYYQSDATSGLYESGFGGGVGVNLFFARYFGIGIEGGWDEQSANGNTVIHNVSGSFIVRYPIDSICLAPYALVGAGGRFDGEQNATYHTGAGLEYRFSPHIGIFGDARYVWTDANDLVVIRTGLRFAF